MIRIANINDLDTINILGNKLHNNFVNTFHMETEINNSDAIVLVCDLDGIVVGYLYALKTIDNIDLLSIIVDESYRRHKIASNLVNYLIDNYCYQDKTITLEVSSNNKEAISGTTPPNSA